MSQRTKRSGWLIATALSLGLYIHSDTEWVQYIAAAVLALTICAAANKLFPGEKSEVRDA